MKNDTVTDEIARVHPMPSQRLLRVEKIDQTTDYEKGKDEVRTPTTSLDEANVVSSEDSFMDGFHRPVLDIDMPIKVIPSTTPGHFHLYIDRVMPWPVYEALLEALALAGVIEPGYAKACIDRKHTAVRLPWVRKGATP